MSSRRSVIVWGALALLAGLALRAVFILHHPRFGGDTLVYGQLAQNMLAHHIFGFSEDHLRPTLIRLPGYPVFLAVCFFVFGSGKYIAVVWVQAFLDLLSCVLLGLVATRLAGTRAGMATLWLACVCPFTANYVATALTETCSLFAVALAIFAMERWLHARAAGVPQLRWAAALGAALAFAVLLRPDQGLLAAAILPAMLWVVLRGLASWRVSTVFGASLPVALATLILVLPLAGWGARNWHVFHVIQPLAPRNANDPGETVPYGFQRWYRTWAVEYISTFQVYWNYDGAYIDPHSLPNRAFDSPQQRLATLALLARYDDDQSDSPALNAAFGALADQRIAAHPLRYYVLLPVARELNMWLRPRTEWMRLPMDWWNWRRYPWGFSLSLVYALLNLGYLVLAMFGWGLWRRNRYSMVPALAAALAGFVVLRCLLLLTLDNSEPRYTLECFPVVILLAGQAAAWLPGKSSISG